MYRYIVHSTCGLVAAIALVAVPAEAKAQYVSSGVGISVATPGFGLNLGFGQPVYRAAPVYVPAYSAYPVYSPSFYPPRPVVVPAAPYWNPYRSGYPYGPYGHHGPHSNHGHHGHPYGHR